MLRLGLHEPGLLLRPKREPEPVGALGPSWPLLPERPGPLGQPELIQRKQQLELPVQPGRFEPLEPVWPLRQPAPVEQLEWPVLQASLWPVEPLELQLRTGHFGLLWPD